MYIIYQVHFGTKLKLRFLDSYRFISSRFDQLSYYLPAPEKNINQNICKNFEEFKLILRKRVFTYDHIAVVVNWKKIDYHQRNFFSANLEIVQ